MCEIRGGNMTSNLPTNHLTDAIKTGNNLRARWLLSNFDFEKQLADLFKDTLEFKNMQMTKTLAWIITNTFFIKHKESLSLEKFRIWPGVRCNCTRKGVLHICSNQFEIIIEVMQITKDIPCEFAGFKVIQLPYEKESKEGRKVTNFLSQYWNPQVCCDNICIPGEEAKSLFDIHSNLSLICSSIIRSSGMPNNHKIEQVRCIQLFCTVKGVIPVGESHFPRSVYNYPTDVLEGCPLLATGIKIGDKIGTLDSTGAFKSQGTLGGFMHHLGFPCFLTCAHVVFDLETLLGRISNEIDTRGIDVVTPSANAHPPVHIGRVMKRVFNHSDQDKTSIDAALIAMSHGVTVDPTNIIVDHFGFSRSMEHFGKWIYINIQSKDF